MNFNTYGLLVTIVGLIIFVARLLIITSQLKKQFLMLQQKHVQLYMKVVGNDSKGDRYENIEANCQDAATRIEDAIGSINKAVVNLRVVRDDVQRMHTDIMKRY